MLILAAICQFTAAILHLYVIWWGPDGYRFFGAGEKMAQMAERGALYPLMLTLLIALILTSWGMIFLMVGGYIPLSMFQNQFISQFTGYIDWAGWGITGIYLIRGGGYLLVAPVIPFLRSDFMLWSSLICLVIGGICLFAMINGA